MIKYDETFDELMRKTCYGIVADRNKLFEENVFDITLEPRVERTFKKSLRRVTAGRAIGLGRLAKTVVACLLVAVVLLGSALVIEPVRAYIWNNIVRYFDDSVEIEFNGDEGSAVDKGAEQYVVPVLPEGWTMKKLDPDEEGGITVITTNAEEIIYFNQYFGEVNIGLDSENILKETMLKNGCKAYLFDNGDGFLSLIWKDGQVFTLQSRDVGEEPLMALAESIGRRLTANQTKNFG